MFPKLFRRTLALLREREVVVAESQLLSFGGWFITLSSDPPLRITMDGRDRWLVIEAELKADQRSHPWMTLWSPETGTTTTAEQIVAQVQSLARRDLRAEAALWATQIAEVIDDE